MPSSEAFDKKLEEILDEQSGADLLAIPGLYEVVSEYFNNQILKSLADAAEGDAEDEAAEEAKASFER